MSSRRMAPSKTQCSSNDRSISSMFKKPSFSSLTKGSSRPQTLPQPATPLPPYVLVTPPPKPPVRPPQALVDVPIVFPPPSLDRHYPLPPPTTGHSYDQTFLDGGQRQSWTHSTHLAGPVSPRGPGFFTGPPPPREQTDMSVYLRPLEPRRHPKRS